MGCHTWFYKKKEIEDLEKLRLDLISELEICLKENKEELEDSTEFRKKSFSLDATERLLTETLVELLEENLKKLNETDLDKNTLFQLYVENRVSGPIVEVFNGCLYEQLSDYHDLFRTSEDLKYTELILTSLEDTLKLIYDNNLKGCSYCDDNGQMVYLEANIEKIKEFWNLYPDGIIDFG